jgi:choice-of-anchor B domain-containing protein
VRRPLNIAMIVVLALTTLAATNPIHLFHAHDAARAHEHKSARLSLAQAGVPEQRLSDVPCVDGKAGPFDCDGVDLLSFVPLDEIRGDESLALLGGGLSDIWGWTDPETADEYVIFGKTNGTAFFRVTDPTDPEYLGEIPNTSPAQLIWHDIKVFDDHAFIVSESAAHGMRVFDLTRLRGATEPQTWIEDVNYPLGFSAHNIAINEETGFAYLVGGNNGLVAPDQCRSGLHIVDINNPKLPVFAGCHAIGEGPGTGGGLVTDEPILASYIHDTQCVIYRGPDEDYFEREICVNSSETHMSVVDVTNKLAPTQISTLDYPLVGYTHQGWFTEDQRYFLLGDEGDERTHKTNTRTMIFDMTDLDAPVLTGAHEHSTASIDHNLYIKNGLVYHSNYTAGLRVTDTDRLAEGVLTERAFFDTFPANDGPTFHGTWSNYPYFDSGTIAVTGTDEGLFLVRVQPEVLEQFEHAPVDSDGSDVVAGACAATDAARGTRGWEASRKQGPCGS